MYRKKFRSSKTEVVQQWLMMDEAQLIQVIYKLGVVKYDSFEPLQVLLSHLETLEADAINQKNSKSHASASKQDSQIIAQFGAS
jgi:hypothetical protein